MSLVQDNHVVQQIPSATPDPAFRDTVLPRTAKGGTSWRASHVPDSRNHIGSKLRVTIEQKESVRRRIRPRLPHLLHNPESIGISRHIEVQDLAPVAADDEKAIQNTKREKFPASVGLCLLPSDPNHNRR
jgi:hypothetical protein